MKNMMIHDYDFYDTIEDDEYFHEIGKLQFDFLIEKGLKPHHRLLDIGCGVLRGGAYFIEYLDDCNYAGIDGHKPTLKLAERRLEELGLLDKHPRLILTSTFEFKKLRQTFDYALAQGVFCHIGDIGIKLCLNNIVDVLEDSGVFYASFLEGDAETISRHKGFRLETHSYRNKNPYHQPLGFYKECLPEGLCLEYLGDWGHPRDVKMLEFVKEKVENGVRVCSERQ